MKPSLTQSELRNINHNPYQQKNNEPFSKPERKFWKFEDFKNYTLPKIQLRKVIKIQALMRGAHVRKKKWP